MIGQTSKQDRDNRELWRRDRGLDFRSINLKSWWKLISHLLMKEKNFLTNVILPVVVYIWTKAAANYHNAVASFLCLRIRDEFRLSNGCFLFKASFKALLIGIEHSQLVEKSPKCFVSKCSYLWRSTRCTSRNVETVSRAAPEPGKVWVHPQFLWRQ